MGLRFFADQCVPNAVIDALNEARHEVFRVKDYMILLLFQKHRNLIQFLFP